VDEIARLRAALRAVLLFHDATAWDVEKQEAWRALGIEVTGDQPADATLRTLCNLVRGALNVSSWREV
jgi:hypothetical protein